MIYFDSSFLTALYIPVDAYHRPARKEQAKLGSQIPYTPLGELELLNTIHRCLGTGKLDRAAHDALLRTIEEDESNQVLVRTTMNQVKLYQLACRLSQKHTAVIASRSLDILHVASTIILGLTTMASYDRRQRDLAAAAGLSLVPAKFP